MIDKIEQEKIIDEIIKSGKVNAGQAIDYNFLKDLYKPYAKQMTEEEFAKLLELGHSNYNNVRCSRS